MRALYVLPSSTSATDPGTQHIARAQVLGCALTVGDPSGKVTAYPSVVVTSTVLAPAIIADTAGQATVTEVDAAKTAATTAEATHATKVANALSSLQAMLPTLGAALTQAQKDAAAYPTAPAATQETMVVRVIEGTAKVAKALGHLLAHQGLVPPTTV